MRLVQRDLCLCTGTTAVGIFVCAIVSSQYKLELIEGLLTQSLNVIPNAVTHLVPGLARINNT